MPCCHPTDSLDANFVTRTPRLASSSPILGEILRAYYGIKSTQITPLNGYDDLNFKLTHCAFEEDAPAECLANGEGKEDCCLLLKLVNPIETQFYPALCEAQAALASLLTQNGINCPQVKGQRNGALYGMANLLSNSNSENCKPNVQVQESGSNPKQWTPFRVHTFLAGTTLDERLSNDLLLEPSTVANVATEIGHWLARFHAICAAHKFCPPVFREYAPFIALEHFNALKREFGLQKVELDEVMDAKRQCLCEQVFAEFEAKVLANREQFDQGLIHSDFNESNLLIHGKAEAPKIVGLLDFGDCHYSFRVADVANAILYIYLLWRERGFTRGKDSGQDLLRGIVKSVLLGFNSSCGAVPLPEFDLAHLSLFIRARLVCSLVCGLRSVRMTKKAGEQVDEYTIRTQQVGWTVLEELGAKDGAVLFGLELRQTKELLNEV